MKRTCIFIFTAVLAMACCSAFAGDVPDPALTPGATREVTVQELCSTKTGLVRHTTKSTKDKVYARYGVVARTAPECTGPSHVCYEVDHRVALEDGGSDVIENLWIQSYDGEWNAHMKDQLENLVHRKICAGTMSIEDGQKIFLGDWTEGYKRLIKPD